MVTFFKTDDGEYLNIEDISTIVPLTAEQVLAHAEKLGPALYKKYKLKQTTVEIPCESRRPGLIDFPEPPMKTVQLECRCKPDTVKGYLVRMRTGGMPCYLGVKEGKRLIGATQTV